MKTEETRGPTIECPFPQWLFKFALGEFFIILRSILNSKKCEKYTSKTYLWLLVLEPQSFQITTFLSLRSIYFRYFIFSCVCRFILCSILQLEDKVIKQENTSHKIGYFILTSISFEYLSQKLWSFFRVSWTKYSSWLKTLNLQHLFFTTSDILHNINARNSKLFSTLTQTKT